MKQFKWNGIPVNIPNSNKEWIFFILITFLSSIISIVIIINILFLNN